MSRLKATIRILFRSRRPELFCKNAVLRNFPKFTEKDLRQSLFLIKLQASALACNFIKKETLAQVFSCDFCEISKNAFSYRNGGCFYIFVGSICRKSLQSSLRRFNKSQKEFLHWLFMKTLQLLLFIRTLLTTRY